MTYRPRTLYLAESIRSSNLSQILRGRAPLVAPRRFMEAAEGNKVLRLMIAAPGVGKSTWIRDNFPEAQRFSTDDYPGLYGEPAHPDDPPPIDFEKLGPAHGWNQSRTNSAMEKGEPHIIIDNTNTSAWQVAPYLHMAKKHGYKVAFSHLTAPLETIRARGSHFPKQLPAKDEPDRLAMMKQSADSFAEQLHNLKNQNHPAPFRELDKQGAFHAPWEDTPEKQQDHSALHNLDYEIQTNERYNPEQRTVAR